MRILPIIIILSLFACALQGEQEPTQQPTTPPPPEPACDDGIRNQGEEDIDCGGPCNACPSCDDGKQNQGEEGIDCGGPCDVCETCDDGIKNQGEVDVDCGGPCKPCDVEYAIRAEDGIELREKLKPSDRAVFLRSSYPTGLEVGESYVFPLGVNNIYDEETEFEVELEFERAEDARTNLIETDEETVMGWLSENELERFSLAQYEEQLLPIGVTIGEEIAPGQPTEPGIYYFLVKISYQRTEYTLSDYTEVDFSVRVK